MDAWQKEEEWCGHEFQSQIGGFEAGCIRLLFLNDSQLRLLITEESSIDWFPNVIDEQLSQGHVDIQAKLDQTSRSSTRHQL